MRNCWASCLGDCEGKLTSEHYLSANILGDGPVLLRGVPWCAGGTKEISAASFTRNMLCKSHNERLSPLDHAGGSAWRELWAFAESAKRAAKVPRRARPTSFRVQAIDGPLFERWLLKTVINLSYLHGPGTEEAWAPPSPWVEIVFGVRPFPEKCGFYLETGRRQARPGGDNYFTIRFLTYPGTEEVCGGQMKINDWGLVVSMTALSEHNVKHHPRFLRLRHKWKTFRVLRFDWT